MNSATPTSSKLLRSKYYHLLGLINFHLKKWSQSKAYFLKATNTHPDQAKSLYMIGMIALRKKRYKKSYQFIRRSLYLRPNHPDWLSQLRHVEQLLGDSKFPKSEVPETEILSLTDRYPNNSFLYCDLAKEYRAKGKLRPEIDTLKKALNLEKNNPYLIYQLAEALTKLQKYSEAIPFFEQALKIKPTKSEWHYSLGYALSCDDPPNRVKSESSYSLAVSTQKNQELQPLGIGVIHQAYERWDLAEEAYLQVLSNPPDNPELLFRIGMCHDRQYNWPQAEYFYEKAITLNPKYAAWHYRLGFVRERQNLFESASSAYGSAADLGTPQFSYLCHYRQGYVREKQQNYPSACEAFAKMAKTIPKKTNRDPALTFPHDKFATPWINDAQNQEKQAHWQNAIEFYQQAITRKNEHDLNLYLGLGNCQMQLGLFQQACISFRQSEIFERAHGLSEAPFTEDPGLRKVATYTEFSEVLEIQQQTIFYESSLGSSLSGKPFAIFKYLLTSETHVDWTHVWSVLDLESIPQELQNLPNIVFVSPNSDLYLRCLATAKILISNDSLPTHFIRREQQIYLNTLPKGTQSTAGNPKRLHEGKLGRTLLQATHILITENQKADELLRQANVVGLAHGKILEAHLTDSQINSEISEAQKPPHKTKPRILIYGGNFGPTGITTSLVNLLNALDYSQLDVVLVVNFLTIDASPVAVTQLEKIPHEVQIVPRTSHLNLTIEEKWILETFTKYPRLFSNAEMKLKYEQAYVREFHRLLGDSTFDATIQFEGYSVLWASILGCIPCKNSGTKSIYQHNDLLGELKSKYRYLEQTFTLYHFFQRIISVSEMTMNLNRDSLSKPYSIPPSKFDFVENIINPTEIRNLANDVSNSDSDRDLCNFTGTVFLTIGRLSVEKDHQKLIQAFASLQAIKQDIRLIILGDGPLMSDLKNQIKELKQQHHIFLLGFKANPFPYLKMADCLVLPSNHEGQPMVLLEAIILEKPIIATDITGSRSVIEGRSGLLVENSAAGLFQGMTSFLNGKITPTQIDMDQYRQKAIQAFHQKACGINA